MNSSTLSDALKKLVENLRPDFLHHMRFSLLGKVVKVYEDNYRVDVIVGEEPDTLALPYIPVNSIFAQDNYGVWALPEVDAEVTVSFYEGDVTNPYVDAPIFYNNKAPQGFKTGTIALVGKHGQKIILKPDSSEVVIIANSIKTIRTGSNHEVTIGDETKESVGNVTEKIKGNRTKQIYGTDRKESKSQTIKVSGLTEEEHGRRKIKVKGESEHRIMGNSNQTVGGNLSSKVLGSKQSAVVGAKQEIVGGSYSLVIANGPTPQPNAYSISATAGNISFNTIAGIIQLGGSAAIEPAVCGNLLLNILGQILTALQQPLQIGNLGAPTAPNPTFVTQLTAIQSQLSTILSSKVFVASVPV